ATSPKKDSVPCSQETFFLTPQEQRELTAPQPWQKYIHSIFKTRNVSASENGKETKNRCPRLSPLPHSFGDFTRRPHQEAPAARHQCRDRELGGLQTEKTGLERFT